MPQKSVELKVILLIHNVKLCPALYDQTSDSCVPRSEKQRMWDNVAKNAGYAKTEDAKSKWRSLNIHLQMHLNNVAKKTVRRYIPNTGNPADKYIQLADWEYFKYLSFMLPHIKRNAAPTAQTARKPNENKTVSPSASNSIGLPPEGIPANLPFNDLSAEDRSLKLFFDSMLLSTKQLPKFHQERVKLKLFRAIQKQQLKQK